MTQAKATLMHQDSNRRDKMTSQQIAAALTKIEANMNSVSDASRAAVLRRAVADQSYRPVQVQAAVEYVETWL